MGKIVRIQGCFCDHALYKILMLTPEWSRLLAFTHTLGTEVISAMNLVMIGVGMSGDWFELEYFFIRKMANALRHSQPLVGN